MLKLLSGLDIKERSKPQTGGIKAQYDEIPYELKVTSTPVPGGERLQVQILNLKQKLDTSEQIGITPELKQKIREWASDRRGCVLVCGPPLSGVTTTMRGVVLSIDSYLYAVYAITELTGIELRNITNFKGNPDDDYEATIARCIRSEADCIYIDPLVDAETAQLMFRMQEKVALMAEFNASDAASGIAKLVSWVGDPAVVAGGLKGIISPKLVRLLCDKCKQAFKPNPKLLEKMGLPPETKVLYRTPKTDAGEGQEVVRCDNCANLGFRGRAPIFEVIEMNEQMQELVAKGPQAAEIKNLARQLKMPSLQREGLRLVAAGRTTIEELQRAFKSS
jgi:type IV pilus assembly protein PilB